MNISAPSYFDHCLKGKLLLLLLRLFWQGVVLVILAIQTSHSSGLNNDETLLAIHKLYCQQAFGSQLGVTLVLFI